jgi:hypothetical protein
LARIPEPWPILAYLIAYDGCTTNTLFEHIKNYVLGGVDGKQHDWSELIDGICILRQGVLLTDTLLPTISDTNVTLPQLNAIQLRGYELRRDAL